MAFGVDSVQTAAQGDLANMVFSVGADYIGNSSVDTMNDLFVTSTFAACLWFLTLYLVTSSPWPASACSHRRCPVPTLYGSHGWSYRLDGSLLNGPHCRDGLQLNKAEVWLLPVAVETLGPWVFANLDVDAEPTTDLIEDCRDSDDRMIDSGRRFTYREKLTTTINGNWKLFVENALKWYHCQLIHSETIAKSFKVGNGE